MLSSFIIVRLSNVGFQDVHLSGPDGFLRNVTRVSGLVDERISSWSSKGVELS